MTTINESGNDEFQAMDKWIYVFMAGVFLTTAVSGFLPSSLMLLAEVQSGERPPIPLILHIHAVLMISWLLLFLTQSLFMALGKRSQHMRLGMISMVLVPVYIVVAMLVIRWVWVSLAAAAPTLAPNVREQSILGASNILISQIQTIFLLIVFYTWAVLVRLKDSATHKRMMVMAVMVTLSAATGRILGLLIFMPDKPTIYLIYTLLLVSPALIYELVRNHRIHKAYLTGIAIYIVASIPVYFLWGNAWWLETAPRIMGMSQ